MASADSSSGSHFVRAIRVNSWDLLRECARALSQLGWVFRGQADASWTLSTTFERSAEREGFNMPTIKHRAESAILRFFKTRAHHHLANPPDELDTLSWLAEIQHFGGPTRLLDVTRSFYVATFFALENAISDAAVWAINRRKLEEKLLRESGRATNVNRFELMDKIHDVINRSVGKSPENKLVLPVELKRVNVRLAAQQGGFLFPVDIASLFVDNLTASFDLPSGALEKAVVEEIATPEALQISGIIGAVAKIILPRSIRKTALQDLQAMNVTAATLFPGLDGLARSMHYHLTLFQN